jgi:hypothetical protein
MAVALSTLGFQVIEGFALDRVGFDWKIREFSTALANAGAGVFWGCRLTRRGEL